MNSAAPAPESRTTRFSRWPWLATMAMALTVLVVLAAHGWRTRRTDALAKLESQIALAVDAKDTGAVREIARRVSLLDGSVQRQLGLAETFLALRMFPELEHALDEAVRASPVRPRIVDKLRAQAAAAKPDWDAAIAHWNVFLQPQEGLPPEQRAAALDELARVLIETHQWLAARERLDERLALGDAPAARLARATVLVRVRQWAAPQDDFQRLQRTAPSNPAVKLNLPRWERVERAKESLAAADDAVDRAPTTPAPRVARALIAARAGLWQNAAEDLTEAMTAAPTARLPWLLLIRLGAAVHQPKQGRPVTFATDALPCLAPGEQAAALTDDLDQRGALWDALGACDRDLASARDGDTVAALSAEQARLECELGEPALALRDVRNALGKFPRCLPAQRVEAQALFAMGNFMAADESVTATMRLHANAAGQISDAALLRIAGLIWQAQGKHGRAVDTFSVLLGAGRSAEMLQARAKSLRFLQRFAEASRDLAEAGALQRPATKEP